MNKPTKCCKCSEPATVFISTIVGSEVKEVSYCKLHAETAGVLDADSYGFIEDKSFYQKAKNHGPSCLKCSMTLTEVKKSSRMGCPECYEAFGEYIESVLQRMHKSQTHLGKIPQCSFSSGVVKTRIEALEAELKELIAKECFEDAAQVRDSIDRFKKIENDLSS